MNVREMLERGICPRCGSRYSYLEKMNVRGNEYYYATHEWHEGGKRFRKRCYIGPVSEYKYVSYMHKEEGLVFRGLMTQDRALEYLNTLVEHFRTHELNDEQRDLLAKCANELLEIAKVGTGAAQNEKIETLKYSEEDWKDLWTYLVRKESLKNKQRQKWCSEQLKKILAKGRRIVEMGIEKG
jgi:hypothetical protein